MADSQGGELVGLWGGNDPNLHKKMSNTTEKWFWMSNYCNAKGISPWDATNWESAGRAYMARNEPTVTPQARPADRPLPSSTKPHQEQGYGFEAQMAHYPDPPPAKRPTLADFPNGLLGTWWAYMGKAQPGQVILHEGDNIELDYPTSTDGIELNWLFDAYTQVEAPEEAQDWAQFEPMMDMEEGPSATVNTVDHHPA